MQKWSILAGTCYLEVRQTSPAEIRRIIGSQ